MSNTFLTPDMIVRDSSIMLSDNLVMAKLSNRNHEQIFANKIGDTVAITTPPLQTARDFIDDSGTVTNNDVTESSVDLTLSEQPYIGHALTTKEKSLELDDFNAVVSQPAILAIQDAIDVYTANIAVVGFSRYTAGTEGSNPSTLAHIAAARKIMQDNGAPKEQRVGVINTTAEASFSQLAQFSSSDYGLDRPSGLREATLARTLGYDWFADQNMASVVRGDVAEATAVKGATQTGTTLIVDKGSAASSGTINRGARFTVAGDTVVYTVMVTVANSATDDFSMTIAPAITSAPADNAVVTWKAANTGNIMYAKNSLAVAIVAPAPLAVESAVSYYNGIGLRVSMSSSTSTLSDQIVYDTYNGALVVEAKGGVVIQG